MLKFQEEPNAFARTIVDQLRDIVELFRTRVVTVHHTVFVG